MIDGKKTMLSGMQSTGIITLGNYLGALKNWVNLADEEDIKCFYGIMDLHSITVRQEPANLRKSARNLLLLYIAAGLDPEKNCIFSNPMSQPIHSLHGYLTATHIWAK